jgi:hypothetical protein
MKTSHIILGAGVAVVGVAALFMFAKKGSAVDPRTYYPGSQGFPAPVPGGAPRQIQLPTPSGKGGTSDTILAAGAVGVAALPYLSDALKGLFGGDDSSALAESAADQVSSLEGLDLGMFDYS